VHARGKSGWSFSVTDSVVDGNTTVGPGVCCGNYNVLRVEMKNGHNGAVRERRHLLQPDRLVDPRTVRTLRRTAPSRRVPQRRWDTEHPHPQLDHLRRAGGERRGWLQRRHQPDPELPGLGLRDDAEQLPGRQRHQRVLHLRRRDLRHRELRGAVEPHRLGTTCSSGPTPSRTPRRDSRGPSAGARRTDQ
jgi:hypothetical protein